MSRSLAVNHSQMVHHLEAAACYAEEDGDPGLSALILAVRRIAKARSANSASGAAPNIQFDEE